LQTAKIAANCIRSLLLQPHPTVADQTMTRNLLPRLVAFVTNSEPEDPENARGLVAHSLCQYVGVVPKDRVPVTMALVVPTLLARAAGEGTDSYKETSARLLELASADQGAFRAVVGAMDEGQKAFMEEVIRSGRQTAAQKSSAADDVGQPSIALKMDFGG
jgi:HEAT repeat-containing protein 5